MQIYGVGMNRFHMENIGNLRVNSKFKHSLNLTWCHAHFVENERLECERKSALGFYYVFY